VAHVLTYATRLGVLADPDRAGCVTSRTLVGRTRDNAFFTIGLTAPADQFFRVELVGPNGEA